jgi:hypothetical protein
LLSETTKIMQKPKNVEVSYRFYTFNLRMTSAVPACKRKPQGPRWLPYNRSLTNLLALHTGNLHHLANFLPVLMLSVHEFLFKTSTLAITSNDPPTPTLPGQLAAANPVDNKFHAFLSSC